MVSISRVVEATRRPAMIPYEAAVTLAELRIALAILRYKAKVYWLKGGQP